MLFVAGDISRPIIYQVENVRDGASFSTRLVHAVQKGENIFVALISYHKHEPSLAVHQFTMPDVRPPEELQSYDELIHHALVYVCFGLSSLYSCKVLRSVGLSVLFFLSRTDIQTLLEFSQHVACGLIPSVL